MHIDILICSAYYGRNGDTFNSSEVNIIGHNLATKQWVSELFYISVANAIQITLSWFLCSLLIIWRFSVLVLTIPLFTFYSGKGSASQYFLTMFPRWSYTTTLPPSVSFLFEEVLLLFTADTCDLIPLVNLSYHYWGLKRKPELIWLGKRSHMFPYQWDQVTSVCCE